MVLVYSPEPLVILGLVVNMAAMNKGSEKDMQAMSSRTKGPVQEEVMTKDPGEKPVVPG